MGNLGGICKTQSVFLEEMSTQESEEEMDP